MPDLALVLAIDSSSSIDKDEFQMQVLGYDPPPSLIRKFCARSATPELSIWPAYSGRNSAIPPMVTKWTRISSNADAEAFADTFLVRQRSAFGNTELGAGLMAALDLLEVPGQCSARSVGDVFGDRRASVGDRRAAHTSVAEARARADAMGVTVNGLAIVNASRSLPSTTGRRSITGAGGLRDGGAGFPRLRRCHRAEAGA